MTLVMRQKQPPSCAVVLEMTNPTDPCAGPCEAALSLSHERARATTSQVHGKGNTAHWNRISSNSYWHTCAADRLEPEAPNAL